MFATECLKRLSGPYALPTLADLRAIMSAEGCPVRSLQDVAIHSARRAGELGLEMAEQPISDTVRSDAISEHGQLMVYAFLRD
jgi:hypothetical protein